MIAKENSDKQRKGRQGRKQELNSQQNLPDLGNCLDLNPDIFYVADAEGNLIRWNSAFEKLIGLPPSKIRRRPFRNHVSKEDWVALDADMKELFGNGETENIYRLVGRGGTLVPYHCNGAVLRDKKGGIFGFTGTGRNVSAFVGRERDLRLNNKFLAETQRIAVVGSYAFNFTDNRRTSSEMLREILGVSDLPEDPRGLLEFVHPDDRAEAAGLLQSVLAEKRKSFDGEFRVIRQKDRAIIWVRCRGEVVYDGKGRPEELIGTIQDITEQRKIEERLIFARKKSDAASKHYRELAETIPIGIIESDLDGVIIFCNAYYRSLLGYEEREIIGMHVRHNFPEGGRRKFEEYYRRLAKERPPPNAVRTQNVRKDGSVVEVEMFWNYRTNADGRLVGFSCVFMDITEQLEIEDGLRKAKEEAERANQLKDKFVSLVAHDLKSPISSILGLLGLLEKDRVGQRTEEENERVIKRILGSGRQLTTLIDDLLNINRLKTGQLKLKKEFFSAKYLAIQVFADVSEFADKKGIKLVNNVTDNGRIYADRALLGATLRNVVGNAVKFCGIGDLITISMTSGPEVVGIRVEDTGPGISREMAEKLFKYEEKTSVLGTSGEIGTGLGLPLARDIMLFHGGDLETETDRRRGCGFTLKLPFARPTILVVEENPGLRSSIRDCVAKLDADVIEAGDGKTALELATGNQKPHLIIADVELPGISGLNLLSKFHAMEETKSIPVIVVSGRQGMEVRDAVFGLGATDIVTKEIDFEDLVPRIRKQIG